MKFPGDEQFRRWMIEVTQQRLRQRAVALLYELEQIAGAARGAQERRQAKAREPVRGRVLH